MKNMKPTTTIGSAVFMALWTAQTALGWYDTSTQRWLTRDPVGEPGAQSIRAATYTISAMTSAPPPSRWISRDRIPSAPPKPTRQATMTMILAGDPNPYLFIRNDPVNDADPLGLAPKRIPIRFWRNCNAEELAACEEQCRPNAVTKCMVATVDGKVVESLCQCSTIRQCPRRY